MVAQRVGSVTNDGLAPEQRVLLGHGGEASWRGCAGISEATTGTGGEEDGSNTHDSQGMRICPSDVKRRKSPTETVGLRSYCFLSQ